MGTSLNRGTIVTSRSDLHGGPAYPTNQYANGISPSGHSHGMTLRDYFAASALQGFIARGHDYDCEFDAARAYAFADAMLRARNAKA